MADGSTARFALPLLYAGQAQKELDHNEALALLDLAIHPTVAAVGLDTPPDEPMPGACWIVGSDPIGAWAGYAHALAGWTAAGWRFVAPHEGMTLWSVADTIAWQWRDANWAVVEARASRVVIDGQQVVGARRAAIPDPQAGDTIDADARLCIARILQAMRFHGLIAAD